VRACQGPCLRQLCALKKLHCGIIMVFWYPQHLLWKVDAEIKTLQANSCQLTAEVMSELQQLQTQFSGALFSPCHHDFMLSYFHTQSDHATLYHTFRFTT